MESYFRTTSYGLVATAVLALAMTGAVDAISVELYVCALGFCYWRDVRESKRLRLREWVWRVLAIAYLPFVFLDAAFLSNRVLALVHMTLFLSAAKLLQKKRDRDWVFLYLIAFFQILLTAGLTFNATFVASLGLFLFFFVSTLAAFEIRRSSRQVSPSQDETITRRTVPRRLKRTNPSGARREPRVRYLVAASASQIVMVALLTLPLFFLIPRLGGGGVARGYGEAEGITGFSDKVELGNVAKIKTSSRVVMRVQLDQRANKYVRWRGVALEAYDGAAWTLEKPLPGLPGRNLGEGKGGVVSGQDLSRDPRMNWSHRLLAQQSASPVFLGQKIVLEPLATTILFAASRPLSWVGPAAQLNQDRYTGAISTSELRGRVAYSVMSDVSTPTEDQLRADSTTVAPDSIRPIYTSVPKLDPRITVLAHEVTRSEKSAYDKARAIEAYLKTSFHYTLDLKPGAKDPLAEFLFDLKEGHCEYFATAMVIMLRTLNIPARIVNGFQMGEYNELNNYYTVRESDAHSWVEVYFPRSDAWIEFDPTPSAGINDYSRGGLVARLRKYADALEVFWLDYVVTLDRDEQASLMVKLQHRLSDVKNTAQSFYLSMREWTQRLVNRILMPQGWSALDTIKVTLAFLVLGGGLMAAYVAVAHRKRRRLSTTGYGPWWYRLFILPTWKRRVGRAAPGESAILFYEQMLAISRRAGLVKQPQQTPLEFATASGLKEIEEITAMYNRVRFGGARLDEDEAQRVSRLMNQLRQAIRNRRL